MFNDLFGQSSSAPLPNLTAEEAKEFMEQFRKGTFMFGLFALIAHAMVWAWKPWF